MQTGDLHVAIFAQTLERVLRFVVHRTAGALRDGRNRQFLDNLSDGRGLAIDRERNVLIPQRAIPLAFIREVQGNRRDVLTLDVAPDVDFSPRQQRVDAQVSARREVRVELPPEFRRLIAKIFFRMW